MRLLWTTICFLLLLPINAFPARLILTVPQGISEVELLSPGTLAVLDHLKEIGVARVERVLFVDHHRD